VSHIITWNYRTKKTTYYTRLGFIAPIKQGSHGYLLHWK